MPFVVVAIVEYVRQWKDPVPTRPSLWEQRHDDAIVVVVDCLLVCGCDKNFVAQQHRGIVLAIASLARNRTTFLLRRGRPLRRLVRTETWQGHILRRCEWVRNPNEGHAINKEVRIVPPWVVA